eukprot:1217408-Rhodomonas_salina.2
MPSKSRTNPSTSVNGNSESHAPKRAEDHGAASQIAARTTRVPDMEMPRDQRQEETPRSWDKLHGKSGFSRVGGLQSRRWVTCVLLRVVALHRCEPLAAPYHR